MYNTKEGNSRPNGGTSLYVHSDLHFFFPFAARLFGPEVIGSGLGTVALIQSTGREEIFSDGRLTPTAVFATFYKFSMRISQFLPAERPVNMLQKLKEQVCLIKVF